MMISSPTLGACVVSYTYTPFHGPEPSWTKYPITPDVDDVTLFAETIPVVVTDWPRSGELDAPRYWKPYRALLQALACDPKANARGASMNADDIRDQGQFDKARERFSQALTLEPRAACVVRTLACVAIRMPMFPTSITQWHNLVQLFEQILSTPPLRATTQLMRWTRIGLCIVTITSAISANPL